jgi:uncharacterized protein
MKDLQFILDTIRSHAPVLRSKYKVQSLAVFGSYARYEQTDTSDVDMLVEFTEPVSLFVLIDTELYLSELLGLKVDLVMKRSLRPELQQSVFRDAIEI